MRIAIVLTGLVLCAATAQADIISGNLNATQVSSTAFGTGSTTQYKAAGFTMPATDYTLDRVTLALAMGTGGGEIVVSIWDGATAPVSQLIVLNNPPGLVGTANFDFTPPSPFTLTAGTSYWVHVRAATPGAGVAFNWNSTNSANPPTGLATFINYSFNGGISTFYNRFQVDGTEAGGPPPCRPDLTTTAAPGSPGYGVPNGQLNSEDFFYFLAQYAANNLAVCDLTNTAAPGSPGYGVPNGILNSEDFFYYLAIYAAGC